MKSILEYSNILLHIRLLPQETVGVRFVYVSGFIPKVLLYLIKNAVVWTTAFSHAHTHTPHTHMHAHTHSHWISQTVEEGTLKTHYMDNQYCTHSRHMDPCFYNTHMRAHTFHQQWQMTLVSQRCVAMVTIRLHSCTAGSVLSPPPLLSPTHKHAHT